MAAKDNLSEYRTKLLERYKVNVNCKDSDGNSPLHLALANGPSDMAGLLIEHGADGKTLNHAGQTPYQYAKAMKSEREKLKVSIQAATVVGHFAVGKKSKLEDASSSLCLNYENQKLISG